MKLDRYVKRALTKLGLEDKVWFHSQNLNEARIGLPKGLPWHGRCWLSWREAEGMRASWGAKLEWHLKSTSVGVSAGACPGERELTAHIALPPVALYFGFRPPWDALKGLWKKLGYESYDLFSVRIHDYSLWWNVLHSADSWKRGTPRWRHGNFRPGRLFGEWVYHLRHLEARKVLIPMPEKDYPATIEMRLATRGHKWNPLKSRILEAEVTLEEPIPFSGKGENSYDCDEDGMYSWSGPARSIEQAIIKTVSSVLETRFKRGDNPRYQKEAA